MKIRTMTGSLFLLAALIQGTPGYSAATVEVAESIPLETTLAVPGIRSTQQVWLEMIGAAKKSIDLEQFYIASQSGEALEPVLNAVKAAAGRGVQVRFILDAKFYVTYPKDADELSQVPNIQVKTIDFSPGVQHAKYFVVDQTETFLGSANFDWLALSHIHEVGLRISDSQLGSGLESVFARDWSAGSAVGSPAAVRNGAPITSSNGVVQAALSGFQLVASPASANPSGVSESLPAVIQQLGSARSSIKIQVYQYTTQIYHSSQRWRELDTAIRGAASRGVHVQLMVDNVALKTGKADLAALASLPNVEVRIVTIPQWSGGAIPYARLVHSKYFVVDGTSGWVGSENWSESYFTNTRNVGVTFQSPETAGALSQIFDRLWGSTYATKMN